MDNYYQILGVTPNASLPQIKRAYRVKAKLLHPDINKANDAHDNFIRLNEAYEYLIKLKSLRDGTASKANSRNDIDFFREEWQRKEKHKARERAQTYARMSYEAYLKSDLFRTTEAINAIIDFFVTAFIILFVVVLPVLLYREHGAAALFLAAIIILPTSPLWFRFLITTFDKEAIRSFFALHHSGIKSKAVRLLLFTLLNGLVLVKVTLKTLVDLQWIVSFYFFAIILSYIPVVHVVSRYKKYLLHFVIAPALVNLLFLINYTFSHSPKKETYLYNYTFTDHAHVFGSIHLENDKYARYKGMRFFIDFNPFIHNSYVTYTISEGLMGIRVINQVDVSQYSPVQE